jgi:DNA-binding transcriptional LysR family regulator
MLGGWKLTLRHLKIFVSVYQNRSITKAGEQLHIAQPAVSLAIKELETHYGITLFDRISRKLYPTEYGNKFYDYAIHIVSLFDELEENIKDWNQHSPVRIGTSITIGNFLLPGIIKKYQSYYPDVRVHVAIKNTETIVSYVLDNKIDFGIIEGDIKDQQLKILPILNDRLCLIANPQNPIANKGNVVIDDLANCNLLLREAGSAGRDLVDAMLRSHQISVEPLWESVSTQALIRGVIHNIGVAILPYLLVKGYIDRKEVVEIPVKDFNLTRHFSIIYHKNKYLTKPMLQLMDLCKDV